MSQDEQATPTPRTDSTIGADKFVPAWKVRKDMGQLERELSAARAEAENFHMAYRMKCDEETKKQAVEIERLRAEAERQKERAEQAELDRDMWKAEVRRTTDEYVKTTREALAEAERLREALLYAAETFRQINEGKHDPFSFDLRSNMRSAAGLALEKTRAALAATRKEEGNA